MTIEETIESFKKVYEILKKGQTAVLSYKCFEEYEVAIEALEKQIPQAVDTDYVQYNNTEDSVRVFICPKCTEYLDTDWDYCPSCGQRLDWRWWENDERRSN